MVLRSTCCGKGGCCGVDSSPTVSGISSVLVSGCITGNGVDTPITLALDAVGGIVCGPNGLAVIGSGVGGIISVATGPCLNGSGTPAQPINIKLDPLGPITCGPDGLTVAENTIVCTRDSFELGKGGTVTEDDPIDFQHIRPITADYDSIIRDAILTLSSPASSSFDVQIFTATDAAGPWTSLSLFTVPAGVSSLTIPGMIGTTLAAGSFIAERVVDDSDAEDMNITVFTESCIGTVVIAEKFVEPGFGVAVGVNNLPYPVSMGEDLLVNFYDTTTGVVRRPDYSVSAGMITFTWPGPAEVWKYVVLGL